MQFSYGYLDGKFGDSWTTRSTGTPLPGSTSRTRRQALIDTGGNRVRPSTLNLNLDSELARTNSARCG